MARIGAAKARRAKHPRMRFGGISVPYPDQPVCGDAWRVRWTEECFAIALCDGLGHGIFADEAAREAIDVFDSAPFARPAELLERVHRRLRGTRGGTVAIACFDFGNNRLAYSGIGNISGRLVSPDQSQGLISLNGTVGGHIQTIREFEYDWPMNATLILHSDGLRGRWKASDYPGLLFRHPSVIAAFLYRDYVRGRDDVSVVGLQRNSDASPS